MPWRRSSVNVNEAALLYNSGWTMEQLGQKYGVTRERIRQKITALVDHSRTRTVECLCCGKKFVRSATECHTLLCSDECRRIRKAEYFRRSSRDLCKCGRTKYKVAKVCIFCKRTFDHDLAAYLYDNGATGTQVAKFLGVKHITVYKAISGLCVSHGIGFRRVLDDSDLKRLAREYKAKKDAK